MGSTGPELFENGMALAKEAYEYDPKAIVIREYDGGVCFFLFGKDEDDALRRLNENAKESLRSFGPDYHESYKLWLSEEESA